MAETWFVILVAMLAALAVLDGWNLGAGMLHHVVARSDAERRQVVAALGPLWSWHEVWLVAAGGVMLLAFPRALAAGFSGFYLPAWFLLWGLLLRGLALEVGGHLDDRLWRGFWDVVFTASSTWTTLVLGLVAGNILRGVPLDATGTFRVPLFTDFTAAGDVGVLDWYTALVAFAAMTVLAAHGATYLRMRTSGPLRERSSRVAGVLWTTALQASLVAAAALAAVRPEILSAVARSPAAWGAILVVAGGGWMIVTGARHGRDGRAMVGSTLVVAGALATLAAAQFPALLTSTRDAAWSLTVHRAATNEAGLRAALAWWPLSLVPAVGSALLVARSFRGRVKPT